MQLQPPTSTTPSINRSGALSQRDSEESVSLPTRILQAWNTFVQTLKDFLSYLFSCSCCKKTAPPPSVTHTPTPSSSLAAKAADFIPYMDIPKTTEIAKTTPKPTRTELRDHFRTCELQRTADLLEYLRNCKHDPDGKFDKPLKLYMYSQNRGLSTDACSEILLRHLGQVNEEEIPEELWT